MLTITERKNETVDVATAVGEIKSYAPRFDLDASKSLLESLNQLKTNDGVPIYAYWAYKGYYIYPALQEWLFWHVCVAIVRHQTAWQAVRGHKVVFQPEPYYTPSALKNLHDILFVKLHLAKRLCYNIAVSFLRWRAKTPSSVVVFDDGREAFRYQKLKTLLAGIVPYSRLEQAHSFRDFSSVLEDRTAFCLGMKAWIYPKAPTIDYANASFLHAYFNEVEFVALIAAIHRRCCDKVVEAQVMERLLAKRAPLMVMGYDQVEEASGYLIGCKLNRIPVVTFQHGGFTKYHAGWIAPQIPKKFCNVAADRLVVWGEHWKQMLVHHSNKYQERQIRIGAHLRNEINYGPWPEVKMPMGRPLTILLPFEFLTDNIAVSAYVRHMLALGWNVWVKIRPVGAGDLDADRLAYDADIRERIVFVDTLGPERLAQVDVVACTQSTVAYEMMSYHKPIWYLETPFHLIDIVEAGIAHSVTHDMLNHMDAELLEKLLMPRYTRQHYEAVFSDQKLEDVLQKLIDEAYASPPVGGLMP